MWRPFKRTCLMLAIGVLGATALAQTPAFLPVLETENLNGQEVVLPRDLRGPYTLILIPFSQEEQRVVNQWIAALDLKNRADLPWIEMPAVPSVTRLIKRQLDGWMRDGIPATEDRARVFTVYTNRAALRRAIGVPPDTATATIVVAEGGRVVAAATGSPTESSRQRILDAMVQR